MASILQLLLTVGLVKLIVSKMIIFLFVITASEFAIIFLSKIGIRRKEKQSST